MPTDLLASSQPPPWVAIGPLIALVPAILCMIDVARHPNTRNLTPQAWLAICAFGNLFGLIAYLRFGRNENR
ncbi:PLD nuclease N-terminal domain-containing protein [Streptomyces sp. NPDC005799]|uniref:PLD nuclease N-terminal domain-containing protein n=1 Tax=Streptomyces sp. NPDC005799 TaxID=3154678 RepID=UPI0033C7F18A